MKRIFIILLLIFILMGLIAGCAPKNNVDSSNTSASGSGPSVSSDPAGSTTTTGASDGSAPEGTASDPSASSTAAAAPKFATPEDFLKQPGIRLSVQAGTVGDSLAQSFVGKENVDAFAHYVDAITALLQDKVQGAVMDLGPALKIVKEKPELVIMDGALTEENYAFGIKKGNAALLEAVNDALKKLADDGSLKVIFDKYVNDEPGAGDGIDFNKGAAGGTLIMGTESGFAPYELRKGDKVVGIDVEIMAAVAKSLDKELVIEDMNFDSLIAAVQSGKIDVIAAGLTVTEDRKKEIDFSNDYVVGAKQVLVVKAADLK